MGLESGPAKKKFSPHDARCFTHAAGVKTCAKESLLAGCLPAFLAGVASLLPARLLPIPLFTCWRGLKPTPRYQSAPLFWDWASVPCILAPGPHWVIGGLFGFLETQFRTLAISQPFEPWQHRPIS